MNHLNGIILTFFILILSCRSQNQLDIINLTGKPGEVLIVMSDSVWEGLPGESCRELFSMAYEMLPQYEPVFDVTHIDFESFRDFFLLHRNILLIEISSATQEASIDLVRDQPAASQLMISLHAPNEPSFLQLLADNSENILNLFEEAEWQRIIDNNKRNRDDSLTVSIKSKYGLSMIVPEGYEVALDTIGFTWLHRDDQTVSSGILIYQKKQNLRQDGLSPYNIIEYRDEVLKQFIPGSVAGSYMTTEKEFAPIATHYSIEGNDTISEIRGLWKMVNGIAMGGPFISLTRSDDQNQTITTVEGFVYAAGFTKRNYMRELEAILITMK